MNASREASRWIRRSTSFGKSFWLWKLLGMGVALALGACGGSGGGDNRPTFIDPDTVTFNYGVGSDASGTGASDVIQQRALDARAEVTTPGDASVEYSRALDLSFLAIDLSSRSMPYDVNIRGGDAQYFKGIPWSTCVTASPGGVEFKGCRNRASHYDLEGSLTRSGTALEWNLLLNFFESDSFHLTGNLQVSAGSVTGQVRADEFLYNVAFTDSADVALTLDGEGCPVGGSLEVKRVYPEVQPGIEMPTSGLWANHGVLFTLTGCGEMTVATN